MRNCIYFFLFGIGFFSSLEVGAQGYYHGAGIQLIGASHNVSYVVPGELDYSGSNGYTTPALFYKATYLFNENGVSMGLSAYPSFGLALNVNSQTGSSGSLGGEVPLYFETYFGDIEDGSFFLGAGFNAGFILSDGGNFKAFGPSFGLGGQFNLKDKLIGLRASYTIGLNKSDFPSTYEVSKDSRTMFSLGVYYPFGG